MMTSVRPRVVVLAFACESAVGSEEGVGWAWTMAAGEIADVTLITSAEGAAAMRSAAAGGHVEVVEVDVPARFRRLFPHKLIFVRYLVWQVLAGRAVRRSERDGNVAVVHHLTWGSDSLPSALLASRAPVRVWGPVGGSTTTARGLYRYLSPRGRIDQVVRDLVNGLLRKAFGERVARHATLVAALNQDVANRFRGIGTPVVIEPHVALDSDELEAAGETSSLGAAGWNGSTALFVGRLIPWKGLLLAVQALVDAPAWRLVVVGEGPEQARAEDLALQVGVTGRVEFVGRVPRREVLASFRTVDALLFPSFHDSAPWSVGEATAAGCPVVCLDAGGPCLVAGPNGHTVTIGDGVGLPQRLAKRLNGLDGRGQPDTRWGSERLPDLLRAWYQIPGDPERGQAR